MIKVWDLADQWYQKWNVIFSLDHMWNWIPREDEPTMAENDNIDSPSDARPPFFKPTTIQPWLDHITQRHHIHPHHRQFLEDAYNSLVRLNQANRHLALNGTGRLNTLPFFPPAWFVDKQPQKKHQGLSPSFVARFVPPYRLTHVPERWDLVFLKGLTVDPERQVSSSPGWGSI